MREQYGYGKIYRIVDLTEMYTAQRGDMGWIKGPRWYQDVVIDRVICTSCELNLHYGHIYYSCGMDEHLCPQCFDERGLAVTAHKKTQDIKRRWESKFADKINIENARKDVFVLLDRIDYLEYHYFGNKR